MTILIDLSVAGINTGPFNLYSDADGYVTAFALNVTRQQLLDGYPAVVTNGTTNIKLQSLSDICPNDTIIPVNTTTSTTSTTTTLNCSFVVNAQEVTTTTTTTATPTTTTTTTAPGISVSLQIGDSSCSGGICGLTGNISTITVYTSTGTAVDGDIIYTTNQLITPYTTTRILRKGTSIMIVDGSGNLSLECNSGGGC